MNPCEHQLFVDDEVIESTVRLTRRVHQPMEFGKVLEPEHPWEGTALCAGAVLRDPETRKFRMWYLGYGWGWDREPGLAKINHLCYAESDDGVHWEKPELGLVEWDGSKANNIVPEAGCPFDDPLETDPQKRFKLFKHDREPEGDRWEAMGHYLSFSPDGVHNNGEWTRILPRCGDRHSFMYDPDLDRPWVCFTRPPGFFNEFQVRMIARTDSADLFNWSKPEPILVPDLDDPIGMQFYGMVGFRYESLYLGFLQRFRAVDGLLDNEIISSRDSKTWHRGRQRATYIPLGPKGSWKATQITFANSPPVEVDDKLYLYYDGRDYYHHKITPGIRSAIGVASLYNDRFVSLFAGSIQGTVTTKPFKCPGGRLMVNVNTCAVTGEDWGAGPDGVGAGYALCEVLDKQGNPIPGFNRNDCERFWDDCRRGRAYEWGETQSLDSLKGRTIRLKFYLVETDLYSFWLDLSENTGIPRYKTRLHTKE